jgi:hypothetical protein
MRPELRSKLATLMRGGIVQKTAVTAVTVVTDAAGYDTKSLKLRQLRRLRHENRKGENNAGAVVTNAVTGACDVDPAALDERKAMAMGCVPERYLDAWARFQLQRPLGVTESRWRQAIDDADCFLESWGSLADTFGWPPGDLFDVPLAGRMGLVWWLEGRNVTALGPEHACAGESVFGRLKHSNWENPFRRKGAPCLKTRPRAAAALYRFGIRCPSSRAEEFVRRYCSAARLAFFRLASSRQFPDPLPRHRFRLTPWSIV